MLAATLGRIEDIQFPVLVSPKLDGIRCVMQDGKPFTRTLKPIPNRYARSVLLGLPNFDGELVVGDAKGGHGFDATESGIMSHGGEPEFTYFVFDMAITDPVGFAVRTERAQARARMYAPRVQYLPHAWALNREMLCKREDEFVTEGYEGLMIRSPDGPYKYGRSTLREGYLLKMVRRQRAEAVVLGVVEKLRNTNEAQVSELGLTKRSRKKANLIPAGDLGALRCRWHDVDGQGDAEFEIGTGFTEAQRLETWPPGTVVTFEYRAITKDGVPRFPSFKGRRHPDDLGE